MWLCIIAARGVTKSEITPKVRHVAAYFIPVKKHTLLYPVRSSSGVTIGQSENEEADTVSQFVLVI